MRNMLKVGAVLFAIIGMMVFAPAARAGEGPPVEIQINSTQETADDLVEWGDVTRCRIRMTTGWRQAMTVVLTCPRINGNRPLSFNGPDGDGNKTLSLPDDGGWVDFSITGNFVSYEKDDAKIKVFKDSTTGEEKTTASATVFWLTFHRINVTPVGEYKLVNNTFKSDDHAVDIVAQTYVQPSGLSPSAPQLSDLRIGIVQNATSATFKAVYKTPSWSRPPIVLADESVATPSGFEHVYTLPQAAVDANVGNWMPLYFFGQAPASVPVTTGNLSTWDTPALSAVPATRTIDAISNVSHKQLGFIVYQRDYISLQSSFLDWVVLLRKQSTPVKPEQIEPLRETDWSLDVSSNAAMPQKAIANPLDYEPTGTIVLTGETAANLLQKSATDVYTGNAVIFYP